MTISKNKKYEHKNFRLKIIIESIHSDFSPLYSIQQP